MTEPGIQRRRFRRAPAEKRARIIAISRACFSEQAYGATTTAEIARRAGVSEGTIFHHFGTKRGLMVAVAENYAHEMAHAILHDLESFDPPATEECFHRGMVFLQNEGALGLHRPAAPADEPVGIVRAAVREALISKAVHVIDAWQERKLVRRMNSRLWAETMFPVFDQLLTTAFVEGLDAISDEWLREIVACMAGSLSWTPLSGEPQ